MTSIYKQQATQWINYKSPTTNRIPFIFLDIPTLSIYNRYCFQSNMIVVTYRCFPLIPVLGYTYCCCYCTKFVPTYTLHNAHIIKYFSHFEHFNSALCIKIQARSKSFIVVIYAQTCIHFSHDGHKVYHFHTTLYQNNSNRRQYTS